MIFEGFLALVAGYASAFGLIDRPQTPKVRPYAIHNVKIEGGESHITLDAEITIPTNAHKAPAIVFITGSGPHNKDEELLGHKPFLVLSDYLTRKGYIVLRFDDRGVGQSTGDFASATPKEFAEDAAAALSFLRSHPKVDPQATGYLGHSEGGYIAPMAQQLEPADFHVYLAGPALPLLPDVMLSQVADVAKTSGATDAEIASNRRQVKTLAAILKSAETLDEVKDRISRLLKEANATKAERDENMEVWATEWARFYANHGPAPALKNLKIPVFALYGGSDIQVSAAENAPIMASYLRHQSSRVVTLPHHNHLFQWSATGALEEYLTISTTMETQAMQTIADWLEETVRSH
ncbi:alpha/beta fold family hydrolase [Roseibium sp. TrichSKD4]|uniref:alpha/beta hydrolase family protein n=1 Tax=Roseibium sp. TrichSKD4 TaxID=744980 RepID=UPI0001E572B5|nr:alpha/beta fold hydrolase [Roseibium sp. TrichSKD4]EFO29093.1 alpha/beta fold family hydrolase [Roseibium sp. TrichSKD4]